jgi:hypothetical protein
MVLELALALEWASGLELQWVQESASLLVLELGWRLELALV